VSRPARQFERDASRMARDEAQRERIGAAMGKYRAARGAQEASFHDWEGARRIAAATKGEALARLDELLLEFERNATARGTQVHWATDGAEARRIIGEILQRAGARRVVKSKVMTSEEIDLNEALEAAGIEVIETDLGEFIQQLRREPPYHFVFPCMHLTREEIGELFRRELGAEPSRDPGQLTMIARRVLRQKFVEADAGITGANFVVADAGVVSITENEGNIRLVGALPRTMITLVGIEKAVPRLADLALFLPMLATAGTGQPLTGYNSLYAGPRQEGEPDGPEAWHVVLLDNGRSRLLADPEQRDLLGCIRCGACLNVCPVYETIGGLSYGTTYQGPIGAAITPPLRGIREWAHLPGASTLCGACSETCPVMIPVHRHLLRGRRNAARERRGGSEALLWRLFTFAVSRPRLYAALRSAARRLQRLHPALRGTRLDPARAWTGSRELPRIAPTTFREHWRDRA